MPVAWDTTVASRAHAGGRHAGLLHAYLEAERLILLPAPAAQEVMRGLYAHFRDDQRFRVRVAAFERFVADPRIEVLPVDAKSALLAGKLLARQPHPPSGTRRRRGTRARQRAAWALDVQIASCAFAGGYGVLTENVDDFGVLREAISELVPGVPPLVVRDARELAEAPA
jgi:predicted nucleic acid-binding protein